MLGWKNFASTVRRINGQTSNQNNLLYNVHFCRKFGRDFLNKWRNPYVVSFLSASHRRFSRRWCDVRWTVKATPAASSSGRWHRHRRGRHLHDDGHTTVQRFTHLTARWFTGHCINTGVGIRRLEQIAEKKKRDSNWLIVHITFHETFKS